MLGGRQVQLDPFYEKSYFKVLSSYGDAGNSSPKVEISNKPLFIIYRLVKAGYGNIEIVKRMSSREVLQALEYEKFVVDYQNAYMELNKK